MILNCSKHQSIGVIQVGSALTAATADPFHEQFNRWQEAEREVNNFVVDMDGVDFMDSAGLGVLITILKRITERGGDVKIAKLQKKPRMVFEITRAYKLFEIYDTVDDALRAFE